MMTSRTSQDPLENFFGIVRQASGNNDHPTPTQFLITVNCLSFYGLVRTVSDGNCEEGTLASLLEVDALEPSSDRDECSQSSATSAATQSTQNVAPQHNAGLQTSNDHNQHVVRSDSRLIYHISGYVARKCVFNTTTKRQECIELLTMTSPGESFQLARLTNYCDRGGLLHPSSQLYGFVKKLGDIFTECFCQSELHSDSVMDMLAVVQHRLSIEIGCRVHAATLTGKVISFYVVTRLHFYVKGLNSDKAGKRQRAKQLKLSRCT
uniref:Transposable element n=1 Tax=Rhipicephalus zambeziensis TaxID=60191 RepID=A0A224Z2C9_9ACAR